MPDKGKGELTIAEAFRELEKITAGFEGQAVDLERGVKDFERGLALLAFLRKKLKGVEERVKGIERKFRDGGQGEA